MRNLKISYVDGHNVKLLDSFNTRIEGKNWDHLKYLQRLTMTLVLIILLIYLWILISTTQGFFDTEFVQITLKNVTYFLIIGVISGIIVGFLELIRNYIKKNWDLHQVVPVFLMMHLFAALVFMIVTYIIEMDPIKSSSLILGFILGGLISIVAYAGEIEREHKDEIKPAQDIDDSSL